MNDPNQIVISGQEYLLSEFTNSDSDKSLSNQRTFQDSRIPSTTALARLRNYKFLQFARNDNYDPTNDVYGFTFSLKALKGFIDAIDQHPRNSEIDGVRVYYGTQISISKRTIRKELFMLPIIGEANLYMVDDDFDKTSNMEEEMIEEAFIQDGDDLILNASVPCPHDCSKKAVN